MRDSDPPRTAWAAAVLLAAVLAGCSPISFATGLGAKMGIAANQERGFEQAMIDTRIDAAVRTALASVDGQYLTGIGVLVHDRRVLLTGAVLDAERLGVMIRAVWGVDGVREVINEVRIADADLIDTARDTWIDTQLKATLSLDAAVRAVNYSHNTVDGIVYLIGIAQDPAELTRVLNHAANLAYVRDIVSHAWVKPRPTVALTEPGL